MKRTFYTEAAYVIGLITLALGTAFMERANFGMSTKTAYDCCSCIIAVTMSFLFIGFWRFEGVKPGTVLCALINGWLIGQCSNCFEKHFDFVDAFKFRKSFD